MRVTGEKIRQAFLITGEALDPGEFPENLALYNADGTPIDSTGIGGTGSGLPPGGDQGAFLAKLSTLDGEVGWVPAPTGGGGGVPDGGARGHALTKINGGDQQLQWSSIPLPETEVAYAWSPGNLTQRVSNKNGVYNAENDSLSVYIAFDVVPSYPYPVIEIAAVPVGAAWDALGYLLDGSGKVIANGDDEAGQGQPGLSATVFNGRYYFVLCGYGATDVGESDVTITLPEGASLKEISLPSKLLSAWQGAWSARNYLAGNLVRHASGLYIALSAATTADEPGVAATPPAVNPWDLVLQGA